MAGLLDGADSGRFIRPRLRLWRSWRRVFVVLGVLEVRGLDFCPLFGKLRLYDATDRKNDLR